MDPLLTTSQVAQRLQIAPETVRRLVAEDGLVAHRVGRQLRFTEADLRDYLTRARPDPDELVLSR